MNASEVMTGVRDIADGFAADRAARQLRTQLDVGELDQLAAVGLLRSGLPVERGGLWSDLSSSARDICEIYRVLATGDPSVALASSMHPAVVAFWLATPTVDDDHQQAWDEQRAFIFDTVEDGRRWGTITSEPGSGGDVMRSNTTAVRDGDGWRITGNKHFGSGSGTTSYMLTTAVAEGDEKPDWFFVPVDGLTDGGVEGISIAAPWDGQGMKATQSHALKFDGARAMRSAWPGHIEDMIGAAAPFFGSLFTAVVLGVVESAIGAAEAQLGSKADSMRPYEQVEWARARMEAWTIRSAYERMLSDIERDGVGARGSVLRGKTISAELAESCMTRLCHVVGGGTFSQRSPFGHWFEDVRALGFLRPPWGLAFDGLIADRS